MIEVVFTGFKPKLSKKKEGKDQSVNLNPEIKVVNDSRSDASGKPLNGQKLFESLNLSFLPRVQDFCHAFGAPMTENGENVDIPGYFDGDTSQSNSEAAVAAWGQYHGPLLNEIGTIELAEVKSRKPGAKPTDTQVDIKRYVCRVAGCTVNHLESLIQS
jgi:hypothetical protein